MSQKKKSLNITTNAESQPGAGRIHSYENTRICSGHLKRTALKLNEQLDIPKASIARPRPSPPDLAQALPWTRESQLPAVPGFDPLPSAPTDHEEGYTWPQPRVLGHGPQRATEGGYSTREGTSRRNRRGEITEEAK